MNIIDYLKNESISCSCNQCQIQIRINSCMHDKKWIFYENLSVFGQIENLWMD